MTVIGKEIYNSLWIIEGVVASRHVEIGSPSNPANRIGLSFLHFLASKDSTVQIFAADGEVAITNISQANPAVVTTESPHGLVTGQQVDIRGSNSGVSIDGTRTATVTGASTFTVPVNQSGAAGTAGSVLLDTERISPPYAFQTGTLTRQPLQLGNGGGIIAVSPVGKGLWLAAQVSTTEGHGISKAVEIADRIYAQGDSA